MYREDKILNKVDANHIEIPDLEKNIKNTESKFLLLSTILTENSS
jgi:hypothetical protein